MASPAFIYVFDSLGPDRFVELCGLLLGGRYRGFLLSGPGPDGGVDGEVAPAFGELFTESPALLLDQKLDAGELTLFQFKHKVVARTGQANARRQLLGLYRTTKSSPSELKRELVVEKRPKNYVLVTNVEVNASFRESFREICRAEQPGIENYEIIGLDDLQAWVTQDHHLRSQFFPMLFGRPRFQLDLDLVLGFTLVLESPSFPTTAHPGERFIDITIRNVGEATSYIANLKFKALIDGKVQYIMPSPMPRGHDPLNNPSSGAAVRPGQSLSFKYYLEMLRSARRSATEFLLGELMVRDQINNLYRCEIPDELRSAIENDSDEPDEHS
ncbi:MAG: hypothetical protein ABI618_06755 [Nitrospirota bacterium]